VDADGAGVVLVDGALALFNDPQPAASAANNEREIAGAIPLAAFRSDPVISSSRCRARASSPDVSTDDG
jgi:hypothetical protein